MDKLEFNSVNVRGLNTPEKRKKIYSWLKECNTEIILLQETFYYKNTNDVSARCEFFKKLKYFISKYRMNENIILCGDFNCKTNNLPDKNVRYLKDLREHLDDMWGKLNTEMTGFTCNWCDAKNVPKSRIDHVFLIS